MTNILLLPQFDGSQSSFAVSTNSDWTDSIFFSAPGSPSAPINLVGQITSGSGTIVVTSTIGLVPGQPIYQSPGIPAGAYIGAITSATNLTMVNGSGAGITATQSNGEAGLTFQPIPLDLTGIGFRAHVRNSVSGTQVFVLAQTSDNTMINGGTAGTLSFNVPYTVIQKMPPANYVMDILAIADSHQINMFQKKGPATVTVSQGVSL
jgi:hypothetical protein